MMAVWSALRHGTGPVKCPLTKPNARSAISVMTTDGNRADRAVARAPDRDDRIVHAFCIERLIDGYPEELEGLAYGSADLWRVLADAASEHERVDPVHARRQGRD